MRLIDADALLEQINRKYPEWYTEKPKDRAMHYAALVYYWAVREAPTVVEFYEPITEVVVRGEKYEKVVRCKDCVYYQDNNNGYPHNECRWRSDETPDATDFCSFGERKNNE